MNLPMDLSADVAKARADGAPIVALESTIISHGMPYPRNIETARAVEATVRAHGATPATIAVIDGRLKIGLSDTDLERLGADGSREVMKLSRRNLASCMASGSTGATTVAATMIAANLAGIEVFATGGIGGVHRGAETSFDVSADLHELARTPVIVVSAGAKAILDVPKTLEVLETLGVPVSTVGQNPFPAFWSRWHGEVVSGGQGHATAAGIALDFAMSRQLGQTTGHLVGNPIPEADEIPLDVINPVIDRALADADANGMIGALNTPYVLQRIFELTEGRSLEANIALVLNNARLAGEIAVCLAKSRGNG
ncbi:MAG: pseudouridine-5'-phosphate glycosidase [Boseongicola sp.]|nr:pseudouridine-5'-phosphate glycosidase [Boseongicola sp.]NNJ68425.1 pseudouridine-5'-phosphate glycosidase [Boseongicola sp.]